MQHKSSFRFFRTYEFTSEIEMAVLNRSSFWYYDESAFKLAASKYSKDTLLHMYIVSELYRSNRRYIRKTDYEEYNQEYWDELFDAYNLEIEPYDFEGTEEAHEWYDRNGDSFEMLFDKMSDEIFHLLFANRGFLLEFNEIVAEEIADIDFPPERVSNKGTLRRSRIPKWAKNAVYHRDKGRCVYCYSDLTGLVNNLTRINYDHIIPLDQFGANDPCNLQLTCESCNKKKSTKVRPSSNEYHTWWKR